MPYRLFLTLVVVLLGGSCSEPAVPDDPVAETSPTERAGADPKLQFVGNWELVGRESLSLIHI